MRFCRFRVPLLAEEPRIGISAGERVPLAFATDAKGMCVEFRATFRTIPASVAQWIEHRFPKPCVAGSIPARGATQI